MKFSVSAVVLFALNFCLNSESTADPYEAPKNLTGVFIMFKNGDRTPEYSFPKDAYYNEANIPEGFGVFLNRGKVRQLQLGKWLRQRYGSYISETYRESDIGVYSADINVCLQSAQSNLAGWYQLNAKDQWYPGLAWDAVPIHTNDLENDAIFAMERACLRYSVKYQEIMKLQNFSDLIKQNSEMVKFLSEKSGWDVTDVSYIEILYDIIDFYKNYNSSYIPSWFEHVDFAKFSELAAASKVRETYTTELRRLKTGQFFYNLFQYFWDRTGAHDAPKVTMVSTTASALVAVLNAMDVFDNTPLQYAATIIWELSKNAQGKNVVSIYYKRNETAELTPLQLDGCSSIACEFTTVERILAVYSVDAQSYKEECEI